MTFLDRTGNIPKFGGDIWYVNAGIGSDANNGTSPSEAFATIGFAITTAAASAKAFSYQIWPEPRRMSPNDGLVVRMINGTDAANSQCGVAVMYED